MIEARVAGAVTARVTPGHPCRAEVDNDELLVGASPLVAQVGNSRWDGDAGGNGVTLRKDGTAIVRVLETAGGVDVFDPQGVALLRISRDGAIANAGGVVLRRAAATGASVKLGDATVTGTNDIALAALLVAPELIPEVRALAACQLLFASEAVK